ncbi:hypothetical protein GCM10010103_39500 [Streptomyces paradoxus]
MRVIGAIAIRFGTVRPPSDTGRDRISAAREAEAATVTWGLTFGYRGVCAYAWDDLTFNHPVPSGPSHPRCDPGHALRTHPATHPDTPEGGTPCRNRKCRPRKGR